MVKEEQDRRVPSSLATEAARLMGKARWRGIAKEERSRQMTELANKGAGRPRSDAERCFCGSTTMLHAAQRKFECCREAGYIKMLKPWKRNRTREEAVAK
jgi:hypothetical protein